MNAPLVKAARAGRFSEIPRLIASGVDPDGVDEHGFTALICSAREGLESTMKALILGGSNLEREASKSSKNALMYAAEFGRTQCVKILLEAGARADYVAKGGRSAVTSAAVNGHHEIVKILFEVGGIIDLDEESTITALSVSIKLGYRDTVQAFVDSGLDMGHPRMPIVYALSYNKYDISKLLLSESVNETVLFEAIEYISYMGDVETMGQLMSYVVGPFEISNRIYRLIRDLTKSNKLDMAHMITSNLPKAA